ncbi:unnamed protein product [Brassicogethes aeneus]|uniref:DUF7869 domain-containing protein n=1 Tax=Brassicogethes aeneus TaxID=1431903 RepID=A0A9P0FNE2_BRAAE|nr:unnamed protein product [Brassicogethes aeneus]
MAASNVRVPDKIMDCDESTSCSDEFEDSCDDSVADKDYALSDNDESSENSERENELASLASKTRRSTEKSSEKPPKSRWRQKREASYQRVKSKRRRNLGQEYLSVKSKNVIKARELGPPCHCKNMCREKLDNTHEAIFNKFWDLGSFDLQNSYLFGCIRIHKNKRSYKKKQKRQEFSRTFNAEYTVNINGKDVQICKVEFMSIHGIQNSRGRINRVVKMKAQGSSVPEPYRRGKHANRPLKLTDEQKQSVRRHIDLIPKYQSHYSRADNMAKMYLNCDMTIAHLYKKFYVPWCEEQNIVPVKEYAYRKIFCTEYNIGFKLPKSDTCKTCDETSIKLETAIRNNDDEQRTILSTTLNLHKSRAKAMQDLLKSEKELSRLKGSKKLVISFDLQQAMPIPKLTTGPAFYCRKIWLYNLGIHDCTAEQGYMYLWSEDKAKRGADEIASVLLKFLNNLENNNVEDLVVFTDNCPEQNKNWLLTSLWLQLVKENRFKSITHHFLISGHTHLPSDRDFALIEKRHRKYAPVIYSPEGWYSVVREANSKSPFIVTVMEPDDFFNFDPILANIKKNTQTIEGGNMNFSGVYSFLFKAENTKSIFVKHTVNGEYTEVTNTDTDHPDQVIKQEYENNNEKSSDANDADSDHSYFQRFEKNTRSNKDFKNKRKSRKLKRDGVYVAEKSREGGARICARDQRDKHEKHPQISAEDKQFVIQHITEFPAYQIHYSRSHSAKRYLSPDLSIRQMDRLYLKEFNEKETSFRSFL